MKNVLFAISLLLLFSCSLNKNIIENNVENIYEKTFLQINGSKHGMFLVGNNKDNPVLLFLHGGPGMPEYGLTQKYPTRLEEHFVVCWYEQRGAGLSYNKDVDFQQLTVENILLDIIEITNYLKTRFNKDKIYLMGHSWGSLLGIKTIMQNPDLYHAYIGVAQIVNSLKSEQIAYKYMLEQYNNNDNKKMVKKLEIFNILESDAIPVEYAKFRDKPMHELGIGTTHEMKSVISGIFLPIMRNTEYTFSERLTIWKAKSDCLNKTNLWETIIKTDLTKEKSVFDIPIYFFHGIYDYTVNYSLTKEYFDSINAPIKEFYTFYNSAHSPMFEEPEKVIEIIINDILNKTEEV